MSLALLVETPSKELADFFGLMLDEKNAPVEIDEVKPCFHKAFTALEFCDVPEQTKRSGENRWLCIYDVLNEGSAEDILKSYRGIGLNRLIVASLGDEGEEWYCIDSSGCRYINYSESSNESIDKEDTFARLLYVA
ncbi:MAG: hypothetical protein OQJ89_03805, partial [Kangiellaceae bacterium]|nr:hypothetical protein [Kangiellaceae bacterium]